VLVLASLSLGWFGVVGPLYLGCAALLGARFLWMAHRLRTTRATPDAVGLFRYSILYLFLLFAILTTDAIVRAF
jgi:protoheme IX farnesyltransferase